MNKNVERIFRSITMLALVLAATITLFSADAFAAKCKSVHVLAYPAWFNGLTCNGDIPAPTALNDVWVIILNIIQWIIISAGYVALFFIIMAGFKYITAQGDPARIKAAKDSLVSSIVGLVIALASVAIVLTVQGAISGKIV